MAFDIGKLAPQNPITIRATVSLITFSGKDFADESKV